MKIQLTNSRNNVEVDEIDYDYLINLCKWNDDGNGYARTSILVEDRMMHRIVAARMGLDIGGKHVHHIDENPLNNRRHNLTVMTASEHKRLHLIDAVYPTGDNHKNTHVKDAEILEKLELGFSLGMPQKVICEYLKLSEQHLGDIIAGSKRVNLKAQIDVLIQKYNWRKGNVSNNDEEVLAIVTDYKNSNLSISAFTRQDNRISRQHLQNVLTGKRLLHLYDKVQQILKD